MPTDVCEAFVEKWGTTDWPRARASESQCGRLEKTLSVHLPRVYRDFAMRFGNVNTSDILNSVVELGIDEPAVQDFLKVDEIAGQRALLEKAGMPKDLIPFANDESGNIFCFKAADCMRPREDCAVWIFDHDFGTVEKVAKGFAAWLQRLTKIEKFSSDEDD